MITESSNHPISLFKFRAGNENDLDALHQDYLWFPSYDELNDPFEGRAFIDSSCIDSSLYKAFREKWNETHKGTSERHACDNTLDDKAFALQWFNIYVGTWRQNTAIFSAAKAYQYPPPETEPEHVLGSMAFWGHYADGLRGYCIEYNFQQLLKSLERHRHNKNIGTADAATPDEYATQSIIRKLS
ncbi:hypothetical protein [uncultured Endozoicomonas sp.]|uniref:hypothetical protein n=1 Tax=uncultured Endozoicomonas sp. TaxID=432652 RepID=UPI002622669B|nr:hypothetical protein [uncultured Endozoicomonas sp.]